MRNLQNVNLVTIIYFTWLRLKSEVTMIGEHMKKSDQVSDWLQERITKEWG